MKYYLLIFSFVLTWEIDYVKGLRNAEKSLPIPCECDEECQLYIQFSTCQSWCKCTGGKILSSDGSKCLTPAKDFGQPCEDNVQCSETLGPGGVCENNECKCKTSFHYLKGRCWKSANLNERCGCGEQCFGAYEYVGFECENKRCQCRKGYYERFNSGCRRKMDLSQDCNLDTDCPDGISCLNMICSHRIVYGIESRPDRRPSTISSFELGNPCSLDSDCKVKYSVCLDKSICGCKPSKYVASEDNKRCLQTARGKVSDIQKSSCVENAQCAVFGGNSICKDRKCACKNGTYWNAKHQFCWPIKHVGEKCKVSEDCHPDGTFAECHNEVCRCRERYHEKGGICVPDAIEVGDHCEENEECLFPNSFCNEVNVCACKENYYVLNGQCLRGVRSECNSDVDCSHLDNTSCRSRSSSLMQCLCFDNHVSSDEGTYCLPVAKYGGECQEGFQCRSDLGELGDCGNGVCQCKNKTHYSRGKCYRSKFVTESCARLQDCHPGNDENSVICLNGFCSCNYGYELDRLGLCVKTNSATGAKPYLYLILAAFFTLHQR